MRSARIDLAALLLRLTVGGLLLFHGYHKISQGLEEGIVPIQEALTAKNLPDVLAWGVYVGELVAPLLLILGLFVPLAGLIVFVNMGMAIYLEHMGQLTDLDARGGGYALALHAFFLLGGLCCALLGAGRFSILGARDDAPTFTVGS